MLLADLHYYVVLHGVCRALEEGPQFAFATMDLVIDLINHAQLFLRMSRLNSKLISDHRYDTQNKASHRRPTIKAVSIKAVYLCCSDGGRGPVVERGSACLLLEMVKDARGRQHTNGKHDLQMKEHAFNNIKQMD